MKEREVFLQCCSNGEVDKVTTLLSNAQSKSYRSATDSEGNSALILAAKSGNEELLEVISGLKVDINAKNKAIFKFSFRLVEERFVFEF